MDELIITNKLLHVSLCHMNDNDEQDAVLLLAHLGLRQYEMATLVKKVDMKLLKQMNKVLIEDLVTKAGLYVNKENISDNENNINHIERFYKQKSSNINSNKNTTNYKRYDIIRKSRKDSLAHYPFADDNGNVADVIYNPALDSSKIYSMSIPARNHFATNVFNELRTGCHGMKVHDVPHGLEMLGINIPKRIGFITIIVIIIIIILYL